MPAYNVVDMVAMWNGIMPASGTVFMSIVVALTTVVGRALALVGACFGQSVFVDVIIVNMVQMTVMQIIAMVVMFY